MKRIALLMLVIGVLAGCATTQPSPSKAERKALADAQFEKTTAEYAEFYQRVEAGKKLREEREAKEAAEKKAAILARIANPETYIFQLCYFYKTTSSVHAAEYPAGYEAIAEKELKKRNAFTAKTWRHIKEGSVYLGMEKEAITCALGLASDINTDVTSYGTRSQYVYGQDGSLYDYVYTRDGVVTSWSY